jgi:hypothetical protein
MILNETIDYVVESYLASIDPRDQQDWLCAAMPRSALYFTAAEARDQLRALQRVLDQPTWHRLGRYHWLLLFESLHTFVHDFNEQPHGALRAASGIRHLHLDRLTRHYFPDTIFLEADSAHMVRGQAQSMLIIPASLGALTGFKPHPDELALTRCETPECTEATPTATLRVSETGEYPAS